MSTRITTTVSLTPVPVEWSAVCSPLSVSRPIISKFSTRKLRKWSKGTGPSSARFSNSKRKMKASKAKGKNKLTTTGSKLLAKSKSKANLSTKNHLFRFSLANRSMSTSWDSLKTSISHCTDKEIFGMKVIIQHWYVISRYEWSESTEQQQNSNELGFVYLLKSPQVHWKEHHRSKDAQGICGPGSVKRSLQVLKGADSRGHFPLQRWLDLLSGHSLHDSLRG